MALARASLYKGPGTVKIGAAGPTFYDKDGISAELAATRFAISSSAQGIIDNRRDDVIGKIAFTPAGFLSSAAAAALYPYGNPVIGASIFTGSDVPSYVHGVDGRLLTFHCSAITKMPDLYLGATKTLFGAAEVSAIYKDNTAPATDNSIYTESASAFAHAAQASATHVTQAYAAVWGDVLASILTLSGWTISFDLGLRPVVVDDVGTIDMLIENVGVMARCTPYNLAPADILTQLKLQGTGVTRGMSLRRGKDLTISGTGLSVKIEDAALVQGPLRWGATDLRAGEIGFIGHRAEATGAYAELFTITVS